LDVASAAVAPNDSDSSECAATGHGEKFPISSPRTGYRCNNTWSAMRCRA